MSKPLVPETASGQLTIGGVLMHTAAWNVLDLIELWLPRSVRGSNVIVPQQVGRLAYPKRIDEGSYSLDMAITGYCDSDGVPYNDGPWIGLQTNIAFLNANVVSPPAAPTATRLAELMMPSGDVLAADIQVLGLVIHRHGRADLVDATLEILIPSGRFE